MNLGPLKDKSKPKKPWKNGLDRAGVLAFALIGVAVLGITAALVTVQPGTEAQLPEPTQTVQRTVIPKPGVKATEKPVSGNAEVVPPAQVIFADPLGQIKVIGSHITEALVFNSTLNQWSTHQGIDLEGEAGSPVFAAQDGIVVSTQSDALWGNMMVLQHDAALQTVYAGLESVKELNPGDKVEKGMQIGTLGSTAICEENLGNHLHFEVLRNGVSVNPEDYLAGLGK